jgi:hypothetical protein
MTGFEQKVHSYFDARTSTLGRIKARSMGADGLILTALGVLVYAQLEGGVKDLASCVLKDPSLRSLPLGEIKPQLLRWRNPTEIDRLKATLDFDNIATPLPFAAMLARRFEVKGINRRNELNQMGWEAIKSVYKGLSLDYSEIEPLRTKIDEIVDNRNEAAHHGVLKGTTATILEKQVRDNAVVVENVLTHFSLQLLPFFANRMHKR